MFQLSFWPDILAFFGLLASLITIIGFFYSKPWKSIEERDFIKNPPPPLPQRESALKEKLDTIHKQFPKKDCPFALVGSVYLDIYLRPIETTELSKDEWSNIDTPELKVGGSSIWVGKFLWEIYKQKSHVYSIRGEGGNIFTDALIGLVEKENWLINGIRMGSSSSNAAITVHLVQKSDTFTTMFTHTGELDIFGWNHIKEEIKDTLFSGGVLYISGYLKTKLCDGLNAHLQYFSQNVLICVDHGRLVHERNKVKALYRAYKAGFVDVYFCTYRELFGFYAFATSDNFPPKKRIKWPSSSRRVIQNLKKLASSENLPLITLVRDENLPGNFKTFVIINKEVFPIKGNPGKKITKSGVGEINAFNAAFMYSLIHDQRYQMLEEQVTHAARAALERWREQCT